MNNKPKIITPEGKSISLFLNNTYPELFNKDNLSKVCLVGNSGKLLSTKYGSQIDKYDIVIRCNHAPTKNYEDYVGSKTTLRIVNGECFAGVVKPQEHTSADPNFLPNLPSQDLLFWKVWVIEELIKGIYKNVNIHNLYFLNSQIVNTIVSQFGLKREPSTGLIMIYLLLSYFNKVDMYGFTFWENKYDYHYFEKVHKPEVAHNFNLEHQIMKQLEQQDRLTIY